MFKKKWVISLILVLVLALSACTPKNAPNDNNSTDQGTTGDTTNTNDNNGNNNNADQENIDEENNNQNSNTGNTIASYEDIKLNAEEAFDIFIKKYPGAKVEKIELSLDDGSYFYKVEGYDDTKEYDLKLEPENGNIVNEEQNDRGDVEGEITSEDVKKVHDLIGKAKKEVGKDYIVDEWTLEVENGNTILDIEVVDRTNNKDMEYRYNIKTGELMEKDQ
ncbi:PepSY domain-containing protein [Wansuia hejianensis]|uniref:PepSY domain-containing protein n=1 Tax=Wansuia hejianensis TaxID=2763667 RepID=A0A926F2N9_9FIRM|nr:PepSY domain-containing protein [Wansuia hejianensis]MBC8590799.1 PepSY domain-containing protein [Wansuia hejianensis]